MSLVVLFNITAPKTRRESAIDQLTSQGNGLAIVIWLTCLCWGFGYATFINFPDKETPDFWPIFVVINSWMGVMFFMFLGVGSTKFRTAVLLWWKGNPYKVYEV